jgi:hypothetical protein
LPRSPKELVTLELDLRQKEGDEQHNQPKDQRNEKHTLHTIGQGIVKRIDELPIKRFTRRSKSVKLGPYDCLGLSSGEALRSCKQMLFTRRESSIRQRLQNITGWLNQRCRPSLRIRRLLKYFVQGPRFTDLGYREATPVVVLIKGSVSPPIQILLGHVDLENPAFPRLTPPCR